MIAVAHALKPRGRPRREDFMITIEPIVYQFVDEIVGVGGPARGRIVSTMMDEAAQLWDIDTPEPRILELLRQTAGAARTLCQRNGLI